MLKRKMEQVLLDWKNTPDHKPLIVKGCRQCGKKPHFMPTFEDSGEVLVLNKLRTLIRSTELAAIAAHPTRQDLIEALNRMSSAMYILMIKLKTTP